MKKLIALCCMLVLLALPAFGQIQSTAPELRFTEVDQSGAAGRWRFILNGDTFKIQRNTAAARNFSTKLDALSLSSAGGMTALSLGSPIIDIPESLTPGTPAADTLRIYTTEDTDFTAIETVDSTGIVRRINQDTYRIARNDSGSPVTIGQAVYYTGSTGNKPEFDLALSDTEATMPCIGLATATVNDGAYGQIMVIGRLVGVKTNYVIADGFTADWTEGDALYVDPTTPGALTNERPSHPNLSQQIGTIEVVHATNGVILVNVQDFLGIEAGTNRASFTIGSLAYDSIRIAPAAKGANRFVGSFTSNDLTAARTWTMQDADGTVAFTGAAPTPHNLFSVSHGDTVAASPVLGDIIYGDATPAWTKLAADTSDTRKFLRTLSIIGVGQIPAWDTVTKADVGLANVDDTSDATKDAAATALTNKTGFNGLVITANTGAVTTGTWNAGSLQSSSTVIAGTTGRFGDAATYDGIIISPAVKGANQFDLTLSTADLTGAQAINFPNESGNICTTGSVCSGYQASGSYAVTALSNLASVALNTALLPDAAAADDFGSATLPFKDIWFAGTSGTPAANNYKLTGVATAARVITAPDASITINAAGDISGTTLAANVVTSSLTTVGTVATGVWNAGAVTINNAGNGNNSYILSLVGKTAGGTDQTASLQTIQGADPYLQVKAPNDSGTATAIMDIHDTVIAVSTPGSVDLGYATGPWKDIYLGGTSGTPGTNNFKLTGASTSGTRVVTFQDASGTVMYTTDNAATATALAADPADCAANTYAQSINASGTLTCGTVTLASADFANQGTTTTVLHGNAAGNPSFGAVVDGDLSLTSPVASTSFTLGIASTTTGQLKLYNSTNGNLFTIQPGATGAAYVVTLPIDEPAAGEVLKVTSFSAPDVVLEWGSGGAAGATVALDNLASVALNTALLPDGAAADDFGSATLPFKDIWFAGTSGTPGTNNFQLTGAATAPRVLTAPDMSGTLVVAAGAQTLTNKTLTNPVYTSQTLSDAATILWNADSGEIATVTITDDRIMDIPSNLKVGTYILHIIQGAGFPNLLTWHANYLWQFDTAPTLSTGNGEHDVCSFISDGTYMYGSCMLDVS